MPGDADRLVCMGISRSDGRHKANSSFHVIPEVPRMFNVSTMMVLRMDKCIDEAHHSDAKLEASQEYLGDQVEQEVTPSWLNVCLSPNSNELVHSF